MKEINKHIIIIILVVTNIITIIALDNMSNRATSHMREADNIYNVMENLLDRIHDDNPDYFLDVLTETDEYQEYEELKY